MDFGQILSLVFMFFFIMLMIRWMFPAIYRVIDIICGIITIIFLGYWLIYGIHYVSITYLGATW